MHTPSALAGSVKLSTRPKITGWDSRTMSVTMGWNTSASNKNVAVSDQTRTDALIFCPPLENPSLSIFVNGQGPAMHDTLTSRNSFPAPASKDMEPIAAFQRPSGEHGSCPLHRRFPVFCTWNVFTALPMFNVVVAFIEYLTRRSATVAVGRFADGRTLSTSG